MANRVRRPCPVPGCRELVESGRCPGHKAEGYREDDRRRGSRHERGYGREWERLRGLVLERDFHLCQVCKFKTATAVDHVVPKADGGTDELENLQSICAGCHDEKTGREHGSRRSGARRA